MSNKKSKNNDKNQQAEQNKAELNQAEQLEQAEVTKQIEINTAEHEAAAAADSTPKSYEMFWSQWEKALDSWNEQSAQIENVSLSSLKRGIENYQKFNENGLAYVKQANKEMREWEKIAREEMLSSTAAVRYVVPFQSFEETNRILDSFQQNMFNASTYSLQVYTKWLNRTAEQWKSSTEKSVEWSRNGRERVVSSLKEAGGEVQDRQVQWIKGMEQQMKNYLFPINKYIERSEQAIAAAKKNG